MSLAPGTRLGPYEVLAPLGAGGMGEVWRARDTKLARDVALKVLPDHLSDDPKALARFENEAKAIAALSHPHILAIHDFGRIDGVSFVVTELLEGETLRAALLRGPPPLRKALDVASRLADALAAAHEKEIVHRDVKPENVILTKDGRAKLLDFGLAHHDTAFRSADDTHSPTVSRNTDPGTILGTVSYMSPEQAQGHPAGFRSDQFSLGVVLYEMLSGKRPFHGPSPAETLAAIIRAEPEPLGALAPSTPTPVRWIVERLLSKDPADRYDSTRDLARDLATCRQHPSEATTGGGTVADASSRSSRGLLLGLGGLLVVAVFGATFFVGRAARTPAPPTFRKLTFGKGAIEAARFTSDGNGVVYSARWEDRESETFTTRLDQAIPSRLAAGTSRVIGTRGAEVARLLPPAGSGALPRLAGQRGRAGTLALAPLGGGSPRPVITDVTEAAWAQDGAGFAVVRHHEGRRRLEYPPGTLPFRDARHDLFTPASPRTGASSPSRTFR